MEKESISQSKWPRVRKFFNDVHLWLGLSSGLIVIAVCFSGTVYVFNTELTERATPHLYTATAEPGARKISTDSLMQIVTNASGGKVISISVPKNPSRTYQYNVKKEGDDSRGGIAYMINPYTGEITGNSKEKNGTREFMSTMFSLHRWLLLDKIEEPIFSSLTNRELGSKITGWATILFTLGCLTGLIIWFPKKLKNWKQGLKVKFNANWKRVNHDLHNTLAFYSLFFLVLMGLTGPQWSFGWYREGLQKTLGTYKPKDAPKERPLTSKAGIAKPASVESYLQVAAQSLPYEGDYNISIPSDSSATVMVSKYKQGFFASPAPDRLTIDQYSGEILKKEIFKEKPFNERVAGSIKALHVGNVYGMFTKILYFLACLVATTLPITGTLIWINKFKKKTKKPVLVNQHRPLVAN